VNEALPPAVEVRILSHRRGSARRRGVRADFLKKHLA